MTCEEIEPGDEYAPCDNCGELVCVGIYGDDLSRFDTLILLEDDKRICAGCVPEYLEEQAENQVGWVKPYEGGKAVWL